MGRKYPSMFRLLASLFAGAFFMAACGGSSTEATGSTEETTGSSEEGSGSTDSDSGLPDLDGQTVTVAVENAYLPFNFIDIESGEPAGWDYAAVNEICDRLNCQPEYVSVAWDGMIQSVADSQFDMAANGITITEERAEIVSFSDGYIAIQQRILVAADNEDITSLEDLAGDSEATVGAQTGTTNFDVAVAEVGEDRVDGFETFGFAVQALINGDVQAVIMDETAGQGYVGENAEDIKIVGEQLSSEELGFVFGPDSDLVDPFNLALADMREDGSLEEISAEFFGEGFSVTEDDIAAPDDVVVAEEEEEEE